LECGIPHCIGSITITEIFLLFLSKIFFINEILL